MLRVPLFPHGHAETYALMQPSLDPSLPFQLLSADHQPPTLCNDNFGNFQKRLVAVSRETRERWLLLTVKTETNGDPKEYK